MHDRGIHCLREASGNCPARTASLSEFDSLTVLAGQSQQLPVQNLRGRMAIVW